MNISEKCFFRRSTACFLMLMSIFVITGCVADAPEGPNIILLINDAWRRDSVGCYNPVSSHTPHIDRFSRQAVIFNNAIAQGPKTINASASMFCSVYPSEHGYSNYNLKISSKLTTIAEILKDKGYATVGISANPHITRRNGLDQGFDRFIDYLDWKKAPDCKELNRMFKEWLNRHKGEKFFAMLWYIDTHVPYNPPAPYIDQCIPAELRGLVTEKTTKPNNKEYFDEKERQISRGLYNGALRYFDDEFNRLLTRLRQEKILDRTVIILTSDHGELFWEKKNSEGRELVGHGNFLYAEELNIPLILAVPGIAETIVVDELVQHVDLLPTIAELAGARLEEYGHYFRGDSLVPLFRGGKFTKRSAVISENISIDDKGKGRLMRCLQDIRYKLISIQPIGQPQDETNKYPSPRFHFYDLAKSEIQLSTNRNDLQPLIRNYKRNLARWRSKLNSRRFPASLVKMRDPERSEKLKRLLKTLGYLN